MDRLKLYYVEKLMRLLTVYECNRIISPFSNSYRPRLRRVRSDRFRPILEISFCGSDRR